MSNWTRRHIFRGVAALPTLPLLLMNRVTAAAARQANSANAETSNSPGASTLARRIKAPTPLLHTTDLYRPHLDPDDHWDLATGYALSRKGDLDLIGVMTDNPQNFEEFPERLKAVMQFFDAGMHVDRSPDIAAVALLNYLTDNAVPVTTGTLWPGKPGEKVRAEHLPKELHGVRMLLNSLRRSSRPVAIMIGGSCQDVAIAGRLEPKLFAEKCAGIYLNVGVGSQNPTDQSIDGELEWNVSLNRGAYATIFELPCPIYWMPCFTKFSDARDLLVGEYGTCWSFKYKDVFPYLSNHMQAYFSYVLTKESGTNWLTYLLDPNSVSAAQQFFDRTKGMWSTAAFVHAAGQVVTVDGEVLAAEAAGERAAYEFVPVNVRCDENGITSWQKVNGPANRYIFRVRDQSKYSSAMTAALKVMLLELP
jgi:hypothetical protein